MLDLSTPADQAPAQNYAVLWLLRERREIKLNEVFSNLFIDQLRTECESDC